MTTPIRRSDKRIANTVTIKGRNCSLPCLYIAKNILGLARLYPVRTRITASTQYGILLIHDMANKTAMSNQTPCANDDNLVLAPAWAFAELRTITAVMGRPPIRPDRKSVV